MLLLSPLTCCRWKKAPFANLWLACFGALASSPCVKSPCQTAKQGMANGVATFYSLFFPLWGGLPRSSQINHTQNLNLIYKHPAFIWFIFCQFFLTLHYSICLLPLGSSLFLFLCTFLYFLLWLAVWLCDWPLESFSPFLVFQSSFPDFSSFLFSLPASHTYPFS